MPRDIRYALRTLLRAPSFTIAAVLTLAAGIAVNTLVFTLLNSLALRPMPVRDADRVVRIFPVNRDGHRQNLFSYPDYLDHRSEHRSGHRSEGGALQSLVAYIPVSITLAHPGGTVEDIIGYAVSANYFPTLGIEPTLGRTFTPGEERAAAGSAVAVISHSLWRRRYDREPTVLGSVVTLNQQAFTIVGVGPERFMGTEPLAPDVWVPIGAQAVVAPGPHLLDDRSAAWLLVAGRLARGASASEAEASLSVVAGRLAAEYPGPNRPVAVDVARGTFFTMDPGLRPLIVLVLAIVGLVLAIASANVANLVLIRTSARQRELAVRLAIGASRWRIVRQLVTESVIVSLLGGALGLLLSVWVLRFLYPIAVSLVPSGWGTVVLDLSPDLRVFAYTAGIALVAGIALGFLPAWQASSLEAGRALREDSGVIGLRMRLSRVRQSLVVVQIAVCLVLLVSAGLLTRGLHRARSLDLGFETERVVFTEYDLRRQGYTVPQARTFNQSLLEFAAAVPGVTAAALTSHIPLHGGVVRTTTRPEGHDARVTVTSTSVSPDYFRALGIRVTSGRVFSREESEMGAPVAVISEGLAARFWPGGEALGRTIEVGGSLIPVTIVGLVNDTSNASLWREKEMALYGPVGRADPRSLHVVVRVEGDSHRVQGALRGRAHLLDARVKFAATPLDVLLRLWLLPSRVAAAGATVLGLVALLLASVGMYGVLAYAVRHRTREIGIRMALGASRRDVMRMVLSDGSRLIATGTVVGVAGALAAGRLLGRFLFDVPPSDPLTFAVVSALLGVVALAACYIPARRAARLEPLSALRMP